MSVCILQGDCRSVLPTLSDGYANCIVTSPPYYGLRDYGVAGQFGQEPTPEAYVATMVAVFRELRRILRADGTLWLNLGDSYAGSMKGMGADGQAYGGGKQRTNAGSIGIAGQRPAKAAAIGLKPKDLMGIPWRVALALQADGWYLRSDIVWAKLNPMPESVRDRPTRAHEYLFLLTRSARYHYDHRAIREPAAESSLRRWRQNIEKQQGSLRANAGGKTNGPMKAVGGPMAKTDKQRGHSRRHAGFNERWDAMNRDEQLAHGRNKRSVWTVATRPFREAHFATFPPALIEPCILAGCPAGGMVLDPFGGAGTTGLVAACLGRQATLIELNPAYCRMAEQRINAGVPLLPAADVTINDTLITGSSC